MGFSHHTSPPICPRKQHCAEWARVYLKYCLCNAKDAASLTLGLISVLSWGLAEIPQIITIYREKSSEGLSLAFLTTWILGDLFNLFGCLLEPATLPTQYYMAILYTLTTLILTSQAIYYGHIYPRLKSKRMEVPEKARQSSLNAEIEKGSHENVPSTPISFPTFRQDGLPRRELYYSSARSLSSSHTPTAGSFLTQRMTPPNNLVENSVEEPLLNGLASTRSPRPSNAKALLFLGSGVTLLVTLNLHQSSTERLHSAGRSLLEVTNGMLGKNGIGGSSGIGTFLGWGMAVIYMGGRLPQIWLNIKRDNVEGLSPLMFVFALVGNGTYLASILVKSLEWSKIKPNLPWLVDAIGCVLLDSFILLQFLYFRYRRTKR